MNISARCYAIVFVSEFVVRAVFSLATYYDCIQFRSAPFRSVPWNTRPPRNSWTVARQATSGTWDSCFLKYPRQLCSRDPHWIPSTAVTGTMGGTGSVATAADGGRLLRTTLTDLRTPTQVTSLHPSQNPPQLLRQIPQVSQLLSTVGSAHFLPGVWVKASIMQAASLKLNARALTLPI